MDAAGSLGKGGYGLTATKLEWVITSTHRAPVGKSGGAGSTKRNRKYPGPGEEPVEFGGRWGPKPRSCIATFGANGRRPVHAREGESGLRDSEPDRPDWETLRRRRPGQGARDRR